MLLCQSVKSATLLGGNKKLEAFSKGAKGAA